jgi:hypothetical protein
MQEQFCNRAYIGKFMRNLALSAFATLVWNASLANAAPTPVIEQSIYVPVPPFENIKQSLYVREQERPLLPLITDASTSIAGFLIDVHASSSKPESSMPHVHSAGSCLVF